MARHVFLNRSNPDAAVVARNGLSAIVEERSAHSYITIYTQSYLGSKLLKITISLADELQGNYVAELCIESNLLKLSPLHSVQTMLMDIH